MNTKPILIVSENAQVIEAVKEELINIDPTYASRIVTVKKKNEAIIKLRNQKFCAVLLDTVDETNYDFLFEFNCPSLILSHPLERRDVEYFIKLGVRKILYYPAQPPQIALQFKRLLLA